jgi:hypothetical protein
LAGGLSDAERMRLRARIQQQHKDLKNLRLELSNAIKAEREALDARITLETAHAHELAIAKSETSECRKENAILKEQVKKLTERIEVMHRHAADKELELSHMRVLWTESQHKLALMRELEERTRLLEEEVFAWERLYDTQHASGGAPAGSALRKEVEQLKEKLEMHKATSADRMRHMQTKYDLVRGVNALLERKLAELSGLSTKPTSPSSEVSPNLMMVVGNSTSSNHTSINSNSNSISNSSTNTTTNAHVPSYSSLHGSRSRSSSFGVYAHPEEDGLVRQTGSRSLSPQRSLFGDSDDSEDEDQGPSISIVAQLQQRILEHESRDGTFSYGYTHAPGSLLHSTSAQNIVPSASVTLATVSSTTSTSSTPHAISGSNVSLAPSTDCGLAAGVGQGSGNALLIPGPGLQRETSVHDLGPLRETASAGSSPP